MSLISLLSIFTVLILLVGGALESLTTISNHLKKYTAREEIEELLSSEKRGENCESIETPLGETLELCRTEQAITYLKIHPHESP